jgi:hypothetical protein
MTVPHRYATAKAVHEAIKVRAANEAKLGRYDINQIRRHFAEQICRAKWFLWHGNNRRALQVLNDVSETMHCCDDNTARTKSLRMVGELVVYLERNQRLSSYAERHLAGEPISSAPVESAVNHGDRETDGQETTDAMDTRRSAPAPTDPNPCSRPPTRQRHRPMAPHPTTDRGLTLPRNVTLYSSGSVSWRPGRLLLRRVTETRSARRAGQTNVTASDTRAAPGSSKSRTSDGPIAVRSEDLLTAARSTAAGRSAAQPTCSWPRAQSVAAIV